MSEPTHFVESNALLAIVAEDIDHAVEILQDMSRSELADLARNSRLLNRLCWEIHDKREDEEDEKGEEHEPASR